MNPTPKDRLTYMRRRKLASMYVVRVVFNEGDEREIFADDIYKALCLRKAFTIEYSSSIYSVDPATGELVKRDTKALEAIYEKEKAYAHHQKL